MTMRHFEIAVNYFIRESVKNVYFTVILTYFVTEQQQTVKSVSEHI